MKLWKGKKLGIVAVVVLCTAMIPTPVVSAEFGSVSIVPWGHSLCKSEYGIPEIELYESAEIEMPEPSESLKSKNTQVEEKGATLDWGWSDWSWSDGKQFESTENTLEELRRMLEVPEDTWDEFRRISEETRGYHWEYEPSPLPSPYPDNYWDYESPFYESPFPDDDLNPPDVYPDFEPGVPGSPFSGGSDDELPEIDPWHPWPLDMP